MKLSVLSFMLTLNTFTLAIVFTPQISIASNSLPPRISSGLYEFTGEIQTIVLFRQELVRGSIDTVDTRTNQLISDGYECRRNADASQLCRKALTNQPLPAAENIRQKAFEISRGPIEIGPELGDAESINEGVASHRWSVRQRLTYQNKSYDSLVLTLIVASHSKPEVMKISSPDGQVEFVLDRTTGTLSTLIDLRLSADAATAPLGDIITDAFTCLSRHQVRTAYVNPTQLPNWDQ
jgi:hypothetical protein